MMMGKQAATHINEITPREIERVFAWLKRRPQRIQASIKIAAGCV